MEIKKLIGDKVLVEVIEAEQKTSFGLILPTENQNTNICKVVMVGPMVVTVKPGDRIQKFKQVEGIPYEEAGKKYLFLREVSDIELILN
jgi:co-chaperonin GroES (HSP10)